MAPHSEPVRYHVRRRTTPLTARPHDFGLRDGPQLDLINDRRVRRTAQARIVRMPPSSLLYGASVK